MKLNAAALNTTVLNGATGPGGVVLAAASLSASGVLTGEAKSTVSSGAALFGEGDLSAVPAVDRPTSATLATVGALAADPEFAVRVSIAADLSSGGTLQAAPSKITDLYVTLSSDGTLSATANVQKVAASAATAQGTLQAAPSKITDLQVQMTGQAALSATGVAETAQTASATLSAQSSMSAAAVRDAAVSAGPQGSGALSATPGATRGVAAGLQGGGSLVADPGRTRTGQVAFDGAGVLTADADTGVVKETAAQCVGSGVLAASPAKTVNVSTDLMTQGDLWAQGATNQEAGAVFTFESHLAAETTGGTPVYRGYLYAKGVAIKPSMSCYTKLKPTFTGDSGVSPSVTGTVIVKPR